MHCLPHPTEGHGLGAKFSSADAYGGTCWVWRLGLHSRADDLEEPTAGSRRRVLSGLLSTGEIGTLGNWGPTLRSTHPLRGNGYAGGKRLGENQLRDHLLTEGSPTGSHKRARGPSKHADVLLYYELRREGPLLHLESWPHRHRQTKQTSETQGRPTELSTSLEPFRP
jgi:hypothetical protein